MNAPSDRYTLFGHNEIALKQLAAKGSVDILYLTIKEDNRATTELHFRLSPSLIPTDLPCIDAESKTVEVRGSAYLAVLSMLPTCTRAC